DEAQSLDQIAHTLFANSPPSQQLETLSLHQHQQTQMGGLGNVFNNDNNNNNNNYSVVSDSIKSEDFQLGFDYPPGSYNSYFVNNNNNYDGSESMLKFMQRSYSSNSFEGKPSFWFQPKFNTLLEVQNFQPEISSSFSNGHMRRVCSTGDLPVGRACSSSASPLSGGGGEGNMMEESNFKVGKYSAEERKERIDRYRAKRTQRNFNKTIKYACRKTLADNRPRIRGRFARNDETGEIPKPTCFNRYEDDDDLWVDNLQEEDEEGILGRRGGGRFLSNFGATHHYHYCGY
ncbi:Zinc finger protein CONSTANS, partial [Bienertia sinuspersici]